MAALLWHSLQYDSAAYLFAQLLLDAKTPELEMLLFFFFKVTESAVSSEALVMGTCKK